MPWNRVTTPALAASVVIVLALSAHRAVAQCVALGAQCNNGRSCCNGLVCVNQSGNNARCQSSGGGGDPHFIGLDGSAYEFHGVSGLNFMLVTEPESQLNAQFHNLGMHADNTYIKALGFVHAPSGHRVTVDSTIEDCSAGVPGGHALAIEVDGQRLDSALQTTANHPTLNATLLQLLKDKGVVVDYHAIQHTDKQLAEHLTIHSDRLKYAIHRYDGACHLDVDMVVLDPELLGSTSMMHGVLGQTARWTSPAEEGVRALQGDEADYLETSLTSHDSKYSLLGREQSHVQA